MRRPLVHVLVINWNGLEHLEACFASLLASTYENARYVLVDNASTDASVAYVRDTFGDDSRVEILELPRNLGWSGGNNAGIRRALDAGAEYIFLLNNDTAVDADAIAQLVDMAEAHPEAGALAPKMLLFNTPELLNSLGLHLTWIGACWDRGIGRIDGPAWDTPCQTAGVCGGAMLLRAGLLEKTGLLPEEFEIYMDDLDLCLRIWDAGSEVWTCPGARIRHKFSASMGEGARARRKYYLNTRNRFWTLIRNFPTGKLLGALPALVLGECRAVGRALIDGAAGHALAHVRAWAAALVYVPRALGHRREMRRHGLRPGGFWPMVDVRGTFCPGAVFPENGWYPERMVDGRAMRPMGRKAHLDVPGGRLRVFHGNCYPSLGEAEVTLTLDGAHLGTITSGAAGEAVFEVRAGRLECHAANIFSADDTGELADLGAWLAVEAEEARDSGAHNGTQ